LIELLEESELTEIEITEGEESIRLSRLAPAPTSASLPYFLGPSPPPPVMPSVPVTSAAAGDDGPRGHLFKSPMVGTYYGSPSPDTEPFVNVGDHVNVGDTLCVIEAMKIFNQLEADKAGTIRRMFKQSGEPVEYGEALFLID
jgi:acetyl-CoA carboxylase biotin carboxyl carrier protein